MTATFPLCPLTMEWWEPDARPAGEDAVGEKALHALQALHASGLPLLRLPESTEDLAEVEAIAAKIQAQSDVLVLVGIGGSSLGAEALTALRPHTHSLRFEVMDNPDPDSFAVAQATLNPKRTSWLFVSKSGGTLETISQILIILAWLEQTIGKAGIAERCVVVTEPKPSSLTSLATHFGIPSYAHNPDVGAAFPT
jgi:glucose-6-phosphate isomerase